MTHITAATRRALVTGSSFASALVGCKLRKFGPATPCLSHSHSLILYRPLPSQQRCPPLHDTDCALRARRPHSSRRHSARPPTSATSFALARGYSPHQYLTICASRGHTRSAVTSSFAVAPPDRSTRRLRKILFPARHYQKLLLRSRKARVAALRSLYLHRQFLEPKSVQG